MEHSDEHLCSTETKEKILDHLQGTGCVMQSHSKGTRINDS
jgi:hypothetical protein